MSLMEAMREADTPRTATVVRVLRWRQASGRAVFHFVGDFVPALIGIGRWLLSGSLREGLIWGGISWLVGSYFIVPILTTNYLVAPSDDEFREILDLFEKNADNRSELRMAIKERRFDLYCEVTPDKEDYIGIKLHRKHWDDLLDDPTKQGLCNAGAGEILEAEKNIYAFWPREDRNAHSVLQFLLSITGASLDEFAVSPITSKTRAVFSDIPEKSSFPNQGVKKK